MTVILGIDTELYFHDCNLFCNKVSKKKKELLKEILPSCSQNKRALDSKTSYCKMREEAIGRGYIADH